jgi:hypothetical protein
LLPITIATFFPAIGFTPFGIQLFSLFTGRSYHDPSGSSTGFRGGRGRLKNGSSRRVYVLRLRAGLKKGMSMNRCAGKHPCATAVKKSEEFDS